MANLDITQDANLTTATAIDGAANRMMIVQSATLKDVAPNTLRDYFLGDYQIVVSVASNSLTVALKDKNGNDPSSSSPVRAQIGATIRYITAALSVTVSAGSGTFNAAGNELVSKLINYFVFLGYRASDTSVFIGISRIPYGRTYADFSSTANNEKYLAYSGSAPASTDAVINIGRCSATLAGTLFWSISGSGDVVNRPIYETDWLTWQPAYSANGSMTYTTVTTNIATYKISWKTITIFVYATGTTGGVANTALNATLPFDALQIAAFPTGYGFVTDGASVLGRMTLNAGTPDIAQAIRYDGANYGLGASRSMSVTAHYEI